MQENYLDAEKYTDVCKKLTPKLKGNSDQRSFLRKVLRKDEFLNWFETEIGGGAIKDFPLCQEKFTKDSFRNMPIEIEKEIYGMWKDRIELAEACSNSFWSRVTYLHIKSGVLSSVDLAASGQNGSGGKEKIEKALKTKSSSEIDRAVRTTLRHLGGLRVIRGRRSVYIDCPFARAWWRGRYASEIAEDTSIGIDKVLEILRSGHEFWEKLVEQVVSVNSTLGYREVRNVLVWKFAELPEDQTTGKNLMRYFRKLSFLCTIQELGIFTVDELKELIGSWKLEE